MDRQPQLVHLNVLSMHHQPPGPHVIQLLIKITFSQVGTSTSFFPQGPTVLFLLCIQRVNVEFVEGILLQA
ncbi:hypothetical protein E1A91_A05G183600v1 [Gossypium mustelinum]|uniref:Uncharacterized protein n=1 Tax=Gossypium mustelinum TaxID=34275 RepID=A0A5D2Z7X8_GOSMU|nr:hypothetical protein E1A91_A05G183600v1 [Gossypium mustelinum]